MALLNPVALMAAPAALLIVPPSRNCKAGPPVTEPSLLTVQTPVVDEMVPDTLTALPTCAEPGPAPRSPGPVISTSAASDRPSPMTTAASNARNIPAVAPAPLRSICIKRTPKHQHNPAPAAAEHTDSRKSLERC